MKPKPKENDTLLIDALLLAKNNKRVSTTFLKENLGIGYERAKKLMIELESSGVVGTPDKTCNRYKEPALEVEVVKDCNESGMALKKEAASAMLESISAEYLEFDAAAKGIESNAINAANLARSLGIKIQTLSGHEQIDFLFWQKHCEGKLPFKFESAKLFVSIAKKMPEPAKTLAEAVSYIQPILVADGALLLPERTESQEASFVNPFQRFLKMVSVLGQPFKKILSDTPMEKWSAQQLDSFAAETEWILVERERAAKLRHAKYAE